MLFRVLVLSCLIDRASAHGNLLRAVVRPAAADEETACAVNAGGACTGTLSLRTLIPRAGNDGACATPPGCEAGCQTTGTLPGETPGCTAQYACDHCGLEKTAAQKELVGNDGSKWWTRMPAAHWDESDQWPIYPCMSRDAHGAGGVSTVAPGDTIRTTTYMNADHSGLYRFELGCGSDADNAAFNAEPVTPWKALHKDKELGNGDTLADSREVGSTRAETDAYWARTVCTGAGCTYRMNGAGPQYPGGAYGPNSNECATGAMGLTCFVDDTFTIPAGTSCRGQATLRWMWNSAEGQETYANCFDINIAGDAPDNGGGGGGDGGDGGTGSGSGSNQSTGGGGGDSGATAAAVVVVLLVVGVAAVGGFMYMRKRKAPTPPTTIAAPPPPPGAPGLPPLPAGWSEATDPSSGHKYYINSATNESTWTRPTGKAETEGLKVTAL